MWDDILPTRNAHKSLHCKRYKSFIDPFDCSAESTGMEELLPISLKPYETRRVTVKHLARSKE